MKFILTRAFVISVLLIGAATNSYGAPLNERRCRSPTPADAEVVPMPNGSFKEAIELHEPPSQGLGSTYLAERHDTIPNIMFDHRPTGSEIELRVLRVAIGESPGPEIPQNSEEPTKAVLD
ncbi:hypothetical protein NLI96_g3452 [Meripilus lineatus]|uniref:Uncharacterized protein n=1 Tax=Meripilus lineatus TaxID=2056292 RepID=A0AAD5V6S5_9APHY|nr:hypothetical protein NLI96_g3452 [Physisporinus lineatus]